MLYFDQIPLSLLEVLEKEINALNVEEAIQWQDRSGLRRQTFEFGISFKQIEENGSIVKYDMPLFLVETRKMLVKLFEEHLAEKNPEKYENCILTIYSEGDGIKAHTDRDYFGPDILGLIIAADVSSDSERCPATLSFFHPSSNERIHLIEKPGTAFLFQGALRSEWKHELAPIVTKRIAIQFRTLNYR